MSRSRLRPPPADSYGLTSRDDTRLLDEANFSSLWSATKAKVDKFFDQDPDIALLARDVTNLTLVPNFSVTGRVDAQTACVLSDLRKLREALVSLRKRDDVARQVLFESARLGILTRQGETYLPALRALLEFPDHPPVIRGWYALYLLFIVESPCEFYMFLSTNLLDHYYTNLALAVIRGNYIAYTRLLDNGSRFDRALIENSPGDIRMKKRIVQVVGKAYYRVEVSWFNRLSKTDRWEKEGNMYIIRRPAQKAS